MIWIQTLENEIGPFLLLRERKTTLLSQDADSGRDRILAENKVVVFLNPWQHRVQAF